MPLQVAAFDVDGTLTVRDCVVPFMRRIAGGASFASGAVASCWRVPGVLVRRDRDALKEHFVRTVFTGRKADTVTDAGALFADVVLRDWMRADVLRRLRWHQNAGHTVVLVSASLGSYLHPLGQRLGVDAVLCTELEEDSGLHTGALRGRNCRGQEKASRLSQLLESLGSDPRTIEWAYGDSSGDHEMLRMARNPFHVRRVDVSAVPG